MLSVSLIIFLIILILGIVGNLKGYKANAFQTWHIWFWNIVWVLALRATWAGFPG